MLPEEEILQEPKPLAAAAASITGGFFFRPHGIAN